MGSFNNRLSILNKLIYRFNEIPTKLPKGFTMYIDKLILKLKVNVKELD